jgi:hypothetical protein
MAFAAWNWLQERTLYGNLQPTLFKSIAVDKTMTVRKNRRLEKRRPQLKLLKGKYSYMENFSRETWGERPLWKLLSIFTVHFYGVVIHSGNPQWLLIRNRDNSHLLPWATSLFWDPYWCVLPPRFQICFSWWTYPKFKTGISYAVTCKVG